MKLGWCLSNSHDECPVRIPRWHHGKKKVGRKNVDAILYTGDYLECDCNCESHSTKLALDSAVSV